MPVPLRRYTSLLGLLAVGAFACTTPSPLDHTATPDQIQVGVREEEVAGATALRHSTDSARIAALLRLGAAEGPWREEPFTLPAGERVVSFYQGEINIGWLRFGPDYIVARSGVVTRVRTIDRALYDSLLALTTWWPPKFEEFPAEDTVTRAAAPIDYATDSGAARFRGQLDGARTAPADFAGHFRFVVWGCGTRCLSHLLLDLSTGRSYEDTQIDFTCGIVEYQRDSRLVITRPDTTVESLQNCYWRGVRYFVREKSGFRELQPPGTIIEALTADTVVRLRVKNGTTVTLVGNRSDGENAVAYKYVGHLYRIPFHQIRVQYYESSGFLLVHDSTGRRTFLRDDPVISPSATEIVTGRFSFATSAEVEVFRVVNDSLVSETRVEAEEGTWAPKSVNWVSNDTILVVKVFGSDEGREEQAYLVREDRGWVLRGPE